MKKIAGKVYSEEAITEFLKSADLKNNGVIDFDEFLVLMEPSKPSSSLDAVGAEDVARAAMAIAADICIYTNDQITFEELSFGPAE